MNEYVILELENGTKCTVVDALEYGAKKYFLVLLVSEKEDYVADDFKLCIYNENKNYLEKITNEEEKEFIKSIFDERLKEKKELEVKLTLISNNLIKLRIIDINNCDYILELPNGEKIKKNISFYPDYKPECDAYIYMSESIIKEKNIFQYGTIYNSEKININEIIKIETSEKEYYLQRYYG